MTPDIKEAIEIAKRHLEGIDPPLSTEEGFVLSEALLSITSGEMVVVPREHLRDLFGRSHMAGQHAAGVDPSYSQAQFHANEAMIAATDNPQEE